MSADLLLTVLGEFVLPNGASAWTQTLVSALDGVGVQEKAARQALARAEKRGLLTKEKHGRRTLWHLSDETVTLLSTGAHRIYAFAQQPRPWDGRWLLLRTSVPEADRSLRYRMSVGLGWAGFGSLGNGLWLSPWTDREQDAQQLLDSLTITATVFRAELGHLGQPAELASEAWDLADLAQRYHDFLATVDASPADPDDEQAMVEIIRLVHAWRHFPLTDPDLPHQLLPDDWPAQRAAKAFNHHHARLLPAATAWWKRQQAA